MPRIARIAPGGLVYHVLNRSVGKMKMFRREADFAAFERIMVEAAERHPMRILAWCVMPTHWHFVVWPREEGQLSGFFRWLAHTHAMRWRVSHHTVGYGHLYQGRFKSFAVQRDEHVRTVCRYVERNALTAGLVRRAEEWRWGSLWKGLGDEEKVRELLSPWPVERPGDWVERVNEPLTAKEIERMGVSLQRGRPLGSEGWVRQTVGRLGLEHTVRAEGRPRKGEEQNGDAASK
jgi:putative transposase